MAKFNDVIEQMIGKDDISKDINAAMNSGNRALVGLLRQKQTITQNIQKMQDELNKLNLKIAQTKLAAAQNKGAAPAKGNMPVTGAA